MAISTISISYLPIPLRDHLGKIVGETFQPYVSIRVVHGNQSTLPFEALVDSGSDNNLFPAIIGEAIGIRFKKNASKPIFGIGGVQIKAYTKKVKLYLYKFEFITEVDFSYEQNVPLLGRNGFFNLFKSIKFREKQQFLDIELEK